MHVLATAGHVDHGKSTLVRALTGTDPDRLAEERRRGLTIVLGYAWTTLPGGSEPVAFVDVPGHDRFVPTMLAGVGPVPAALLVVAADDAWMPQAEEHLRALDALGVRHAVVAVTRSDRADPGPMVAEVGRRLGGTGLAGSPVVAVSAVTGAGLTTLRSALSRLTGALPRPDAAADVRLWIDRQFSVVGAGTVVTGTLPAGTVKVGDRLELAGAGVVRVRSMQSLGAEVEQVSGTARVALRLGAHPGVDLDRGAPLVTPGAWWPTTVVDVRLRGAGRPPREPRLHIGASAVPARLRALDDDWARLTLGAPLPLRIGDRALLRDPGTRAIWGVEVVDPAPPTRRRRGAAAERGRELADASFGSLTDEVRRRGPVRVDVLRRIGVATATGAPATGVSRVGDWLLADELVTVLRGRLTTIVAEHRERYPLESGPPVAVAAQALDVPDVRLLAAVVRPPLATRDGRVVAATAVGPSAELPAAVERALGELVAELTAAPFAAPAADRLAALGLDRRALAAAHRAGRLLRVADQVVLLPGADRLAAGRLATLPQPFTTSQARQALDTSRRVALPLLEFLDHRGITVRLPDDRRHVTGRRT